MRIASARVASRMLIDGPSGRRLVTGALAAGTALLLSLVVLTAGVVVPAGLLVAVGGLGVPIAALALYRLLV